MIVGVMLDEMGAGFGVGIVLAGMGVIFAMGAAGPGGTVAGGTTGGVVSCGAVWSMDSSPSGTDGGPSSRGGQARSLHSALPKSIVSAESSCFLLRTCPLTECGMTVARDGVFHRHEAPVVKLCPRS